MSANFSGGLVGLGLLTGNTSLMGLYSQTPIESRAVRLAKAQFTAPRVVAPWQQRAPSVPVSTQVATIKGMATIIDPPSARDQTLLPDIQTTFTAFKALDRLRILAETAAKKNTSSTERGLLSEAFDQGMADLKTFLGNAPSDKVQLTFGLPTRSAESVKIPHQASATKILGKGLLETRTAPLQGVTGTEVLKLSLTKNGQTDVINVDLSQSAQPPTLDSVAGALNAAITSIPMRYPDGTIVSDTSGNPTPKYSARFTVDKGSGKWGLALDAPGFEKVSLDQVGANDALIVASGSTAPNAPASMQISRFDNPATAFVRQTLGTISAIDREATERAALSPPPAVAGTTPQPVQVHSSTTASAITTDAEGNSYLVGTTAGDLGSNRSTGDDDLFLTKVDSEGRVIWQRTLGASGSSKGAAITIASNGDVLVAGTVTGPFDGSLDPGSDMLVARFDANGDEKFATTVRTVGNEEATAIAVGADGSVFIGGSSSSGGGDGFIARISAAGVLQERRVIDTGGSERVTALAIDGTGELLALTKESGTARLRRLDAQALATDLGAVTLGAADARAIAVSASGEIAVAGAAHAALPGAQLGSHSGGRDGFVARIDAAFSGASVSYIGTGADDQVDSVAFMNGALYVGGRTTGSLDGARRGAVDGFVGRIDLSGGAVLAVQQFGQTGLRAEPVRISASRGGGGMIGALGLQRGTLNADTSPKLVAQTSLREGDSFSLRVNGGAIRKITIDADDSLETLANRIRSITGSKGVVKISKLEGKSGLRIEAKAGNSVELIAGPEDKDALTKLGLDPVRLATPAVAEKGAPSVQPGGRFGLSLTEALSLGTAGDAAVALNAVKSAMSYTQTAFRSLYWDSSKAARVDGIVSGGAGASPYQKAQLGRYQDALNRITALNGSNFGEWS